MCSLVCIPFCSHFPGLGCVRYEAQSLGPYTWAQALEIRHFLLNVSGALVGTRSYSKPLVGVYIMR